MRPHGYAYLVRPGEALGDVDVLRVDELAEALAGDEALPVHGQLLIKHHPGVV